MSTKHNLFVHLMNASLAKAAAQISDVRIDPLTPPRDPKHGNYASSAAFVLARETKRNPREIAQELCESVMESSAHIQADVAGAGFVNITFSGKMMIDIMADAAEAGPDYGQLDPDENVILEYGSANPTGPLHIGHARGLVVGSAMANLLRKAGHDVKTEYYMNHPHQSVGWKGFRP